jgi:hypothetical protein
MAEELLVSGGEEPCFHPYAWRLASRCSAMRYAISGVQLPYGEFASADGVGEREIRAGTQFILPDSEMVLRAAIFTAAVRWPAASPCRKPICATFSFWAS